MRDTLSKITIASRLDRIMIVIVSSIIFATVAFLSVTKLGWDLRFSGNDLSISVLIIAGIATIYLFIFTALELVFKTTPFKYIFGVRVTSEDGSEPSARQLLIRNIFRITDDFLLVGRVFMFFDRKNRRLGDRVAKTCVVEITDTQKKIIKSESDRA